MGPRRANSVKRSEHEAIKRLNPRVVGGDWEQQDYAIRSSHCVVRVGEAPYQLGEVIARALHRVGLRKAPIEVDHHVAFAVRERSVYASMVCRACAYAAAVQMAE